MNRNIEINYHFVCEKIQQGLIYTDTWGDQFGDISRKAFNVVKIYCLYDKLDMINIDDLVWGRVLQIGYVLGRYTTVLIDVIMISS